MSDHPFDTAVAAKEVPDVLPRPSEAVRLAVDDPGAQGLNDPHVQLLVGHLRSREEKLARLELEVAKVLAPLRAAAEALVDPSLNRIRTAASPNWGGRHQVRVDQRDGTTAVVEWPDWTLVNRLIHAMRQLSQTSRGS